LKNCRNARNWMLAYARVLKFAACARREFTLGWLAAVPLLEPRGAGAQVGGDGLAAGGEHAHHAAADALDLEPVAVVAGDPFQAEPMGESFLRVLGDDRGDGSDVLVVAERVRGAPFPVGGCFGDVADLGVDVQLHVAVARGVLQPVRHGQVRLMPLAGLPAVHPGAVGAGAGVAGFPLEVAEPGVHGRGDAQHGELDQSRDAEASVAVPFAVDQEGLTFLAACRLDPVLRQRRVQVDHVRA